MVRHVPFYSSLWFSLRSWLLRPLLQLPISKRQERPEKHAKGVGFLPASR